MAASPAPDPSTFAEQRALFAEARRLPTVDQATYVRSRASSKAVADEVLALLDEEVEAGPEDPGTGTTGPKSSRVRSTATDTLLARLDTAPRFDAARYLVERPIGQGGMGAVLRIHDRFLNRRLAMKVMLERRLPDTAEGRQMTRQLLGRFLEEAQVTSQLDHPGVVPLHELGLDANGEVYFTMRLVKGRTATAVFADAFAEQGEWNLTRALEVVLKVCDTMAYAHDKGVLHRDLKPDNVMVGRFGEVYVMDWGLAKQIGEPDLHDLRIAEEPPPGAAPPGAKRRRAETAAAVDGVVSMDGQQLGTPSYMSPEQALGEELDVGADVYSIGAMLYELVTGRAPYTEPDVPQSAYRILDQLAAGPPPAIESLRKGVPAELVAVIEKAMARERTSRYPTVQELASDLRAFLAHRVVSVYRTGAWQEAKLWVRRNRPLAVSLTVALLLLVTVGSFAAGPGNNVAAAATSLAEFELLALVDEHRQLLAEAAALRQREAGSEAARAAWLPRAVALLAREDELRRATTAARRHADDATAASSTRAAKRVLAATLGDLLGRLPELAKLVEELRAGR